MTMMNHNTQLHIRYDGRSMDIPFSDLDIGPALADNAIKRAIAAYLDVPVDKFRHYVIDRHENGNMTIRPEAVFG